MDPQIAQIVEAQVLSALQEEEARIDAELKRLGEPCVAHANGQSPLMRTILTKSAKCGSSS